MGPLSILFGVFSGATVAMSVWANCHPYGQRTHLVAMACMMMAAWWLTQALLHGQSVPDAWRYAVVITTTCAIAATRVALRHPAPWAWILAALLGIEIGLHGLFWYEYALVHLNRNETDALKWWYTLAWNVGTALQLTTLFWAGANHVVARSGGLRYLLRDLGHHFPTGAVRS